MYAYQFRLIVVGDSTVGKSSLLRYFCDGKFCDDSDPTVGVDFYARILEIKPNTRVKLQIWDTGERVIYLSFISNFVVLFDGEFCCILKLAKSGFAVLRVRTTEIRWAPFSFTTPLIMTASNMWLTGCRKLASKSSPTAPFLY